MKKKSEEKYTAGQPLKTDDTRNFNSQQIRRQQHVEITISSLFSKKYCVYSDF